MGESEKIQGTRRGTSRAWDPEEVRFAWWVGGGGHKGIRECAKRLQGEDMLVFVHVWLQRADPGEWPRESPDLAEPPEAPGSSGHRWP